MSFGDTKGMTFVSSQLLMNPVLQQVECRVPAIAVNSLWTQRAVVLVGRS